MPMLVIRLVFCLMLAVCSGVAHAEPASHVRVVLDISASMRAGEGGRAGNDPVRNALLSTALLRALQNPNSLIGSTFKVFPFPREKEWAWSPGGEPPGCDADPLVYDSNGAGPADFDRSLLEHGAYRGQHTWYYPCVQKALSDLQATPGADPRRVLVLLTDGLPADERSLNLEQKETIKVAEKTLMRTAVEEARSGGRRVDVYIIAVGVVDRTWLQDLAAQPAGDRPLAVLLPARSARDVPDLMVRVFEESFGYGHLEPPLTRGQTTVELAGADRVAVVAFGNGGRDGSDEWPRVASGTPLEKAQWHPPDPWNGFGLTWRSNPNPGSAQILAPGATRVLVLRPREWVIETTGTPIREVLAERDTLMSFLVKRARTGGAPEEVSAKARPEATGRQGALLGIEQGSLGPGIPQADGTLFTFKMQWPKNPADQTKVYEGKVRVTAAPNGSAGLVGASQEFPVKIHPPVSLRLVAEPDLLSVALGGAEPIQEGDTPPVVTVKFQVEGTLPESALAFQFSLGTPLPAGAERVPDPAAVLRSSTFRLALPLDVSPPGAVGYVPTAERPAGPGKAGTTDEPTRWLDGVAMTRPQLEAGLTLSLEPKFGDRGGSVTVPLNAFLNTPPYSNYPDLIAPLPVQVTLAEPSLLNRVFPFLAASLVALWLLASLWYGRDRPTMPPDFRVRVWPALAGPAEATELYPSSAVRMLLGLVRHHPLALGRNCRFIGMLEPIAENLYRLRVAPNVGVSQGVGPAPGVDDSGTLLAAGATYQLTTPDGPHLLWLGFDTSEAAP